MNHPFSETYILMAKAAEEIQAGHTAWNGDYCLFGYPERPDWAWQIRVEDSPVNFPIARKPREFFIPRLDQLLGMLAITPSTFGRILIRSNDCMISNQNDIEMARIIEGQKSWHECALEMVMRANFGKRWDGERWVKI